MRREPAKSAQVLRSERGQEFARTPDKSCLWLCSTLIRHLSVIECLHAGASPLRRDVKRAQTTHSTPITAAMLVMASRRWAPSLLAVVQVLEEVDDGNCRVGEVSDENDLVTAPFSLVLATTQSDDGNGEDEQRREPDEPVRLELLGPAFELLVGEVPLEVDQRKSRWISRDGFDHRYR